MNQWQKKERSIPDELEIGLTDQLRPVFTTDSLILKAPTGRFSIAKANEFLYSSPRNRRTARLVSSLKSVNQWQKKERSISDEPEIGLTDQLRPVFTTDSLILKASTGSLFYC